MKIRPQLILTEVLLNIVLLAAVLFSIASFVNFIGFEDLKIKTATIQDTATQTRYSLVGMLIKTEPALYLTNEYQLLADQLAEDLGAIGEDRLFRNLPKDIQNLFFVIESNWDLAQRTFNTDEMEDYLNLRQLAPEGRVVSLMTLQSSLKVISDTPFTVMESVDDAVQDISYLETSFNNFEGLLDKALNNMLTAAERYRRLQFILALLVPMFLMLVALFGVFIFSNVLSQKLRKLDRALTDIAGGDFSVRVDLKGRDEFNSLATSVNAFTRTLGAKLESFRLMMHEIGQTLTTNVDSTQVEETLIRLAMRDTIADGAALYKVEGEGGGLMLSAVDGRFRPPFAVSDLPESPEEEDIVAILRSRIIQPGATVIGESAIQGQAHIIRNVQYATDLDWARSEGDPLFLSSLIVVPLQIGSTVFGALVITSSRPGRYFSDLEYANMQSFGELAAITLDNIYKYADLLEATQLNRELGIAEEIQQDLLPKRLPRLAAGEVAYLSRSIKGLNGDYFDVYPLGNGKTMVTICEVAGRGVPAGLVMVMIRTILRLVATADTDAKGIMTRLNQDMTRRIAIENYASVGILIVDNDGRYTFSSAAHYPLQILRAGSKEYESVQTEGIPVGIDREATYLQEEGLLNPNDLVLFHTDGIPESRSRSGEIFGIDSLLRAVSSQAEKSPEDIIENLRTELEYHERDTDQKDDQTVIILKYTGGEAA